MIARPTWFWTSLFCSITVNGILFASAACYLYSQTSVWTPGYGDEANASPIIVPAPNPPMVPDTLLGDSAGKGTAADASAGADPMEARFSPNEQAFLSRDPEGPGHVGDPPSMSTQIPGENGGGASAVKSAAEFGVASAAPAQQPTPNFPISFGGSEQTPPKKSAPPQLPDPVQPTPPQPTKAPPSADQPTADQTNATKAASAQPSVAHPAASSGKPGPAQAAADPAPQSDSESDPFSSKGAVKFKPGRTDVQFGRKHKIIRPQLGLGAQTDLIQLRPPITLVLALTLDETGKVTRVTILRSSGSNNIDQACKVAAYQWWLEPSKDQTGKPVKDVIPFVIGFS